MALQHSITLESGISCPAAYTRIQSIQHTHFETVVLVQTWADGAARLAEKPVISTQSYSIPWSEQVCLPTVYAALKLMPEFVSALDV